MQKLLEKVDRVGTVVYNDWETKLLNKKKGKTIVGLTRVCEVIRKDTTIVFI